MWRSKELRAALGAAALVVAAVLAIADRAGADVPGAQADGATVDRVGWWNEANEGVETPATAVTTPAPDVPATAISVGALAGDPDRIAAIGIVPDAAAGSTIDTFTLTLTEASSGNAGADLDSTVIQACPVTFFWAGEQNGRWSNLPEFDCERAAVDGQRSDDGTWTFDLTPIGALWLDGSSGLAPDGVVLKPADELPGTTSFRVTFETAAPGSIGVVFAASAASDPFGPTPTPGVDAPADGGFVDVPAVGGEPVDLPEVTTPPTAAVTTTTAPTEVAGAPIAADAPGLPGGTVPLLLTGVGVLLLMSYALGPAGEPVAHVRERGVSRALAARARDTEI